MRQRGEESSERIKQLRRENQLVADKLDNSLRAIKELQTQIEGLLKEKKVEAARTELRLEKERERGNGLERSFKRGLQEKELLEAKMKAFHEQLEGVEVKMHAKVNEIANLVSANGKLTKQNEELRALLQKQRRQEQQEQAD